MKPNVSCSNDALKMTLLNNSVITNIYTMLDSKVLKPCGMLVLNM